jgi:hypothetical protein
LSSCSPQSARPRGQRRRPRHDLRGHP